MIIEMESPSGTLHSTSESSTRVCESSSRFEVTYVSPAAEFKAKAAFTRDFGTALYGAVPRRYG